jgi:enoyl-CoA hydratase/carnithine racemase
MAEELIHAFNRASDDDAVRVIIVTGAGRAFCAGMDLSTDGNVFGLDETLAPTLEDMEQRLDDPEIVAGVRDTGGRVTLAIYDCKKPVIAAINGPAVGIGATMTCAMDIRLASEKARIGFVFNKIGIVPEACSSWFLPRVVGLSQALEWVYSADILQPDEALQGGLVKAVLPAEELLDEAYRIARRIARHSPVAIALTRQMMYRNSATTHPLEAHKVDSLAMFYTSLASGKEGVQSFLEKRDAVFTDTTSKNMPDFYPWWE